MIIDYKEESKTDKEVQPKQNEVKTTVEDTKKEKGNILNNIFKKEK
jgi:hypothetical protein